jgi:hypothetical protein
VVSEQVRELLPFLIMAVAVGSQLSAIVNDTEPRTEIWPGRPASGCPGDGRSCGSWSRRSSSSCLSTSPFAR